MSPNNTLFSLLHANIMFTNRRLLVFPLDWLVAVDVTNIGGGTNSHVSCLAIFGQLTIIVANCLESGLKPGFHENLTYDHSACCEQKGISQQCKAMCKPSDMEVHHFDPTSCKNTDYQSFLGCVTEGGRLSNIAVGTTVLHETTLNSNILLSCFHVAQLWLRS